MNITLFKKHNNGIFRSDIMHSYFATPMKYGAGMFSDFKNQTSNFNSSDLTDMLDGEITPQNQPVSYEELEDAEGMFFNQQNLKAVKVDFPKVKDIQCMFTNCNSLETIECDFSSVTGEKYKIKGIDQLEDTIGSAFLNCDNLKTLKCNFQNLTRIGSSGGAYGFTFEYSPNLTVVECDFRSLDNIAKETYSDGSLETNNIQMLFSGCTNIETFKCNFNNLKNADNMLVNCNKLTNFDCDFDSLESAVNLCPNANLTVESVKNIAEKIKPHDDNEVHLITLGIPSTKEGVYLDSPINMIFEGTDYWEHFTTLREKGWTVEPIPQGLPDYTYTLNDADIVTNVSIIEAATGETYIKENQKNHGIFAFALSKSHFIGTDENRNIKRIIIANDGNGSGWTAPGEGGYMALRFIKNNNIVGEDCYWSNNTQQWNSARKNYIFNFENIQLPTDYDVIRITLVKSSKKDSVTFDTNFIPDSESRYKFRTNVVSTAPATELQHNDDSVCYCDLYWPDKRDFVVETIVQLG